MIPLPPEELARMWQILDEWEWQETYGAFHGLDVRGQGKEIKARMLESMKIQVRGMGWKGHEMLAWEVE